MGLWQYTQSVAHRQRRTRAAAHARSSVVLNTDQSPTSSSARSFHSSFRPNDPRLRKSCPSTSLSPIDLSGDQFVAPNHVNAKDTKYCPIDTPYVQPLPSSTSIRRHVRHVPYRRDELRKRETSHPTRRWPLNARSSRTCTRIRNRKPFSLSQ